MRLRSRAARRAGLNVLGVLVALVTLFPILWMVSPAFKPAREIYSLTPHLLPSHPTLGNFRSVIDGKVIGLPYWNFLKNSLFVTLSSVIASMLISLLAAIAVARFRFRLRTSYLIMVLIGTKPRSPSSPTLASEGTRRPGSLGTPRTGSFCSSARAKLSETSRNTWESGVFRAPQMAASSSEEASFCPRSTSDR